MAWDCCNRSSTVVRGPRRQESSHSGGECYSDRAPSQTGSAGGMALSLASLPGSLDQWDGDGRRASQGTASTTTTTGTTGTTTTATTGTTTTGNGTGTDPYSEGSGSEGDDRATGRRASLSVVPTFTRSASRRSSDSGGGNDSDGYDDPSGRCEAALLSSTPAQVAYYLAKRHRDIGARPEMIALQSSIAAARSAWLNQQASDVVWNLAWSLGTMVLPGAYAWTSRTVDDWFPNAKACFRLSEPNRQRLHKGLLGAGWTLWGLGGALTRTWAWGFSLLGTAGAELLIGALHLRSTAPHRYDHRDASGESGDSRDAGRAQDGALGASPRNGSSSSSSDGSGTVSGSYSSGRANRGGRDGDADSYSATTTSLVANVLAPPRFDWHHAGDWAAWIIEDIFYGAGLMLGSYVDTVGAPNWTHEYPGAKSQSHNGGPGSTTGGPQPPPPCDPATDPGCPPPPPPPCDPISDPTCPPPAGSVRVCTTLVAQNTTNTYNSTLIRDPDPSGWHNVDYQPSQNLVNGDLRLHGDGNFTAPGIRYVGGTLGTRPADAPTYVSLPDAEHISHVAFLNVPLRGLSTPKACHFNSVALQSTEVTEFVTPGSLSHLAETDLVGNRNLRWVDVPGVWGTTRISMVGSTSPLERFAWPSLRSVGTLTVAQPSAAAPVFDLHELLEAKTLSVSLPGNQLGLVLPALQRVENDLSLSGIGGSINVTALASVRDMRFTGNSAIHWNMPALARLTSLQLSGNTGLQELVLGPVGFGPVVPGGPRGPVVVSGNPAARAFGITWQAPADLVAAADSAGSSVTSQVAGISITSNAALESVSLAGEVRMDGHLMCAANNALQQLWMNGTRIVNGFYTYANAALHTLGMPDTEHIEGDLVVRGVPQLAAFHADLLRRINGTLEVVGPMVLPRCVWERLANQTQPAATIIEPQAPTWAQGVC